MRNFVEDVGARSARRLRHMWFAAWLMVPAACSSSETSAPSDAGTPGEDAGVCGHIGESCTANCPDNLRCEMSGQDGACLPVHKACNTFAGGTCDAAAPNCMVLGTDQGTCLTDQEKLCACERSPELFNAVSCGRR